MPRRPLLFVLLLLAGLGPACGGGDSAGPSRVAATRLAIITQPPASAQNRVPLTVAPLVQLADSRGVAVGDSGVLVTAAVLDGSGYLLGERTRSTDGAGRVVFPGLEFTAPPGLRRLEFSAPGLAPDTSDFISVRAGAPTLVVATTPDSTGSVVGALVTPTPTVRVADQDGYPVTGALINVAVVGGGSVPVLLTTSGANGLATVGYWILGQRPGLNRLTLALAANAQLSHAFTVTTVAGPPGRIVQTAGSNQTVPVTGTVPVPPQVQVADQFGNPLPGVTVVFTPNAGAGRVTGGTAQTDAGGFAAVGSWTVDTVALTAELIATVPVPLLGTTFVATVTPGAPAHLAWGPGIADTVIAPTGFPLGPFQAIVTDTYGNRVPGTAVSWAADAGTVEVSESQADGQGVAALSRWTLGLTPGVQALEAALGTERVTLRARAHAGRTLTKVAGDSQQVTAGSVAPVAPAVRVADQGDNPVADVPVAFSVGPSGGSITGPSTVLSDPAGIARAGAWTVGTSRASGSTLVATVFGLGVPPAFHAEVLSDLPAAWSVAGNQFVRPLVGRALTPAPRVAVLDRYGNGVPDVPLAWAIRGGGGTIAQAAGLTDSLGSGSADWTLGTVPGPNELLVTSAALAGDTARLVVQAAPGPPASLTPTAGGGQSAAVHHVLPVSVEFRLLDPYGNLMPNEPVTFRVDRGGTVDQPSGRTSTAGIATPGTWRLGGAVGTQTITASASWPDPASIAAASVEATAVPAQPVTIAAIASSAYSLREGAVSPIPFGVLVRDDIGFGVEGDTVRFQVTGGGITLPSGIAVTDTGGIARLRDWQVGSGLGTVVAASDGLPGATVVFNANGRPPATSFDISYQFVSAVSPAVEQAFTEAATRWRRVILGDIPDVTVNLSGGVCVPGQPAFSGVVDDLKVFVRVAPIDGAGGILGGAAVCVFRSGSSLPAIAGIQLDSDDLAGFAGLVPTIVLHEIGHALGIGSSWAVRGLVSGVGTANPLFLGASTQLGYWSVRGAQGTLVPVPVEGTAGPGSRDVHWSEDSLRTELMTPFINGFNPLSLVTTGSLQDLGYVVDNAAADPNFSLLRRDAAGPSILLRELQWTGPVFEITPTGELIPR